MGRGEAHSDAVELDEVERSALQGAFPATVMASLSQKECGWLETIENGLAVGMLYGLDDPRRDALERLLATIKDRWTKSDADADVCVELSAGDLKVLSRFAADLRRHDEAVRLVENKVTWHTLAADDLDGIVARARQGIEA